MNFSSCWVLNAYVESYTQRPTSCRCVSDGLASTVVYGSFVAHQSVSMRALQCVDIGVETSVMSYSSLYDPMEAPPARVCSLRFCSSVPCDSCHTRESAWAVRILEPDEVRVHPSWRRYLRYGSVAGRVFSCCIAIRIAQTAVPVARERGGSGSQRTWTPSTTERVQTINEQL